MLFLLNFLIRFFPRPLFSQHSFAYYLYYSLLTTFSKWFRISISLILYLECNLFCILNSFSPEKNFYILFCDVLSEPCGPRCIISRTKLVQCILPKIWHFCLFVNINICIIISLINISIRINIYHFIRKKLHIYIYI